METLEKKTIGEYVAQDFRTAALFSKYGIDFCCKGNRSVEEVCEKKDITPEELQEEINAVMATKSDNSIDFQSWPMDLLADYIEKTHHRYVESKLPTLLQFLDKLCKVHGASHPELFEINQLFIGCAGELTQHMKKEELILFPFIKKIAEWTNNYTPPADACNTYKVTFAMLNEFEQDLHKHIHLENNILFPKAAKLEKSFQAQL